MGCHFMGLRNRAGWLVALALMAQGTPAFADVKAGVDAWSAGDFARAVKEWRAAADAGDPDAQFNLAQAYRLARGVPADMQKAEYYYGKAAAQGHMQAADNYGLMLFQDGRRTAALPYIKAASERGDPRAQYLLGVAHFNGDLVPKDWTRAYALVSLANTSGLPQARPALEQMDQYIPIEQRQAAAGMVIQMQQRADATRGRQLAAADLKAAAPPPVSPRVPKPIEKAPVAASSAPTANVLLQTGKITGGDTAATAGADYARPRPQAQPPKVASPPPAPPQVAKAPAATPGSGPQAQSGSWRLQLGAFGVRANAERLWSQIGGKGPLAGKTRMIQSAGSLTKLFAAGFASSADAASACERLKSTGQSCLVVR